MPFEKAVMSAAGPLPRRGGPLLAWIGRTFLRLAGWSIKGQFPELRKLIVVVAPHTSNWDFVYGLAAVFALTLEASWVGKHTLFRPPFGSVMRWLGGIAVDRRHPQGVVGGLVEEFRQRGRLLLAITPEGTRSRVERWKTGFYHLAIETGVPLVPVYFDYRHKQLVICEPFAITGDLDADLLRLQRVFSSAHPKHSARFNPRFS